MSTPIEDYALLSNCHSAALVGRDGSIDWLCFPCFDSAACFASLLGNPENGRWLLAPTEEFEVIRQYTKNSLALESVYTTKNGSCKVTDCMILEEEFPTLVRTIEGISGDVELVLEFVLRFDYGSIVPWVRRNNEENGIHAVAGPDAVVLYSDVPLHGKNLHTVSHFSVSSTETKSFVLTWYPSHLNVPKKIKNPMAKIKKTIRKWQAWAAKSTYKGADQEGVMRSLLTLKALSYDPTGAIVAAPTTSLPEEIGGGRNWDYRYGWIRDSSFTLLALIQAGFHDEALRWNQWLLRAVAGTPSQVNLMYGIRGERRLTELEITWLPGYENSLPVRIGNEAYKQFQLDVFGELIATAHFGRLYGIPIDDNTWRIESKMVEFVINHWREPDEGIWEVRGQKRQFTHSKLMAWVALRYAAHAVKEYNLKGDLKLWEEVRDEIHEDICKNGFDSEANSFVQYYGSKKFDASLLMMPLVEFLPPTDERIIGTVKAIQTNLIKDGLVMRYIPDPEIDDQIGDEGTFLPCSFWLVRCLSLMGRHEEANGLYTRLQNLKSDVGLYAEEYSTSRKRMVGNYPQAFTHIMQILAAMGLER